jgi:hypothetical protein
MQMPPLGAEMGQLAQTNWGWKEKLMDSNSLATKETSQKF